MKVFSSSDFLRHSAAKATCIAIEMHPSLVIPVAYGKSDGKLGGGATKLLVVQNLKI